MLYCFIDNKEFYGMAEKDKKINVIKNHGSGIIRAIVVALMILLNFAIIIWFSLWLVETFVYIYIAMEMSSILIMLALINDDRSSSYKISWICVVIALPIMGHIMYSLWGKKHSNRKIEKHVIGRIKHGASFYEFGREKKALENKTVKYLEANGFPAFCNNSIKYFPMGEDAFEAILADMQQAKKFILVDFFIVAEGELWTRMHEIIKQKISEGVKVYFMYDDWGSMFRISKDFKRILEKEGAEVRIFNPVHKYIDKLYMNYRSHQKIVVIDGEIGYTGGMNLADEYMNIIERFGVWKDTAVRVEGEAVWGMTVTFFQMWEAAANKSFNDYLWFKSDRQFEKNDCVCQIISDGPSNNPANPIADSYKQIIYNAEEFIYITTPYLIIDDDMREALVTAAQSGIDVRLITPAIPDKKSVKLLTEYNYGALLKGGVKIYEYTPGFIHAKNLITEKSAVVGTINFDYRSFYLHYECGAFFMGTDELSVIKKDFVDTMEVSKEVFYEEWQRRPWTVKLKQNILNVFATLM